MFPLAFRNLLNAPPVTHQEDHPVRRSPPDARNRRSCPAGIGSGGGVAWRHGGARHRGGGQIRPLRPRLLSSHRRLPGKDICRRPHSRRFLPPGRPPQREGNSDFAADRPADAPVVSQGLPQRDADHGDRGLGGPGHRSGHPGDDRRVGRRGLFRDSVQRADRRGAGGICGRAVPAQSRFRRGFRIGSRPGRGRHERRGPDGGIGSARAVRGGDARRGDVRSRADAADHRPYPRACRGNGAPGVELGPAGGGFDPCGTGGGARGATGRRGLPDRRQGRTAGNPGGGSKRGRNADRQLPGRGRRAALVGATRQGRGLRDREAGREEPDPGRSAAHRRPGSSHRAGHHDPRRLAASHPRVGPVHPRRNPGSGRDHPRQQPRRADRRRPGGRAAGPVSLSLQLSALLRW